MTEYVSLTETGMTTIPAKSRKKYRLKPGVKFQVVELKEGILLKPVISLEDLAGVDAGKISIDEAMKKLERMRLQDRY